MPTKFRTPDIPPGKMVERFGFVLSGCEPKPVRFLIFQSKLRGSDALGDRRRAAQGCDSSLSGAAIGLPVSPLWVRTKTCPLFDFSVEATGLRRLRRSTKSRSGLR